MSAVPPDRSETWVQPILVAKEGTHEQTIALAARASAALYHSDGLRTEDRDAFEVWLDGPFTKTVRRASRDQIRKVAAACRETGIPFAELTEDASAALALPPMRYDALPKAVSRLQVSGTDLPRRHQHFVFEQASVQAPVTVHVAYSLTTGKAAAQAAHALWVWMLHQSATDLDRWRDRGMPIRLLPVSACVLADLERLDEAYPIRDNGLTEVAPNTLTAVACSVETA